MHVTGSGSRTRRVAALAVAIAVLLLSAAAPPNDTLVDQQAHLVTVRAFEAWDIRRGEGAVVAVLDTGVDLDHPDLAGRLVPGIDLVEPGTEPDDPEGHGTIVAGVIAAVADNGRGVAGTAPQAMVMPIRVLDGEGRGTSDVVAAGIRHAIEQQVQVINLSLAEVQSDDDSALVGGLSLVQDRDVVTAMEEAAAAGILIVAAAGNDGRSRTPYAADTPVIVVGATDSDGAVWSDSNRDDRTLFAPGVGILSTWREQKYARSDGTSFATPIVAAGAAMLMGAGVDAEEATRRLVETAVPIEGAVGLGRVDLAAAVAGLQPAPPPPAAPPPAPQPPAPANPPPPNPPAPAAPAPAATAGPLEAAEPVEEVVEPQPVPAQVTEPPPPVAVDVLPTSEPPQTALLEPAEVVTDPSAPGVPAAPTTAAPIQVSGAQDDGGRGPQMTVAAMLLGLDVLLAGWVIGRRR